MTRAGDPQCLAVGDSRGNLHIDRPGTAVFGDGHPAFRTRKRLLQRHFEDPRIGLGLGIAPLPLAGPAEQAREEIAEAIEVRKALSCALAELISPVGRRSELLAGTIMPAQLIVGGTLLGIFQDLIGLLDILEFRLGVPLLADIRMELAGQFAVGALDRLGVRAPAHPQRVVVILELHALILSI